MPISTGLDGGFFLQIIPEHSSLFWFSYSIYSGLFWTGTLPGKSHFIWDQCANAQKLTQKHLQGPEEIDDAAASFLVLGLLQEQRVGVLDAVLHLVQLPLRRLVLVQRAECDLQLVPLHGVDQPLIVQRIDEPVPQYHLVVLGIETSASQLLRK